MSKLAVLIVHGSWFQPAMLSDFTSQLAASGLEVRCPKLPTSGDHKPPKAGLEDDVNTIRREASELKQAGYRIAILAHSFGGLPTTEAITDELCAQSPGDAGVGALIYLSAFVAPPGNSYMDVAGRYGFQSDLDLQFNEDGTTMPKNALAIFYHDLEDQQQAGELAGRHVPYNFALVGDAKFTNDPWARIPTFYIRCTGDLAWKPPIQEGLVKELNSYLDQHNRRPAKVNELMLDSGHCPFYSQSGRLIDMIKSILDQTFNRN